MKKAKLLSYLSLGVVFAIFNVISFVIPTAKTETFWTAYAFAALAFFVQIPLWEFVFFKKDSLHNSFFSIPVICVGIGYLVVQLIAFIAFMIFPTIPVRITVVVCAIILAISALAILAGVAGVEFVTEKKK